MLLRHARLKEELGVQDVSEVLGFSLILKGDVQTVGERQQCSKCSIFGQRNSVFFHVNPPIVETIAAVLKMKASFTELEPYSCFVFLCERTLLGILAFCLQRTTLCTSLYT